MNENSQTLLDEFSEGLRNNRPTIQNAEVFQAFSALSDAQTVIELGGDADEINHQIGHAKHHLWKIMDGWDSTESLKAMMPYEGCNYGSR